jgi:hypothetical protein
LDIHTVALNFNYTLTAENYTQNVVYLHGSLREKEIVLGYDPQKADCLAPYEMIRWFKPIERRRLDFTRKVRRDWGKNLSDQTYDELCEDYEMFMNSMGPDSSPMDELERLKHGQYLSEIIGMHERIRNLERQYNVNFDQINEIIVIGHSIKSDLNFLKHILEKMTSLKRVVIFSFIGETKESWESKASFFCSYCSNVEKVMY